MQKLFLLHGALGSAAHFNTLKELLSDTFEIHTLNFESHGGRDVTATISIPGFAEEVIAYLEKHDMAKISIFGYSMGGYVGLYLAKHHSERIEKLFTLATKLDWNPEGAAKEAAMLDHKSIQEKVPKFAASLQELHGQHWEELMGKTAAMMLELGDQPALKDQDFREIPISVLLAVGDKDAMVSVAETEYVVRLLPHAQLRVFPDTIHPIDRVNPEMLSDEIKNYFR